MQDSTPMFLFPPLPLVTCVSFICSARSPPKLATCNPAARNLWPAARNQSCLPAARNLWPAARTCIPAARNPRPAARTLVTLAVKQLQILVVIPNHRQF